MLLNVSLENYKSFNQKEELSLISSSKIHKNADHKTKIGKTFVLKNAVIYGANASGKSNFIKTINFIQKVLYEGLTVNTANDFCRTNKENKDKESIFEIQFAINNKFYAYGFSAILNQRKITEEWLFELKQNGNANNLFMREFGKVPALGDNINPSEAEKNRFSIYAEDFAGHDSQLFLSEMNRGKRYDEKSKLIFFKTIFEWIMEHIIVIRPTSGISNADAYYSEESLEEISNLIKTFDTGITEIKTKKLVTCT